MRMMEPNYFSAVVDLIGGAINGESEGPLDTYTFLDGQTPPTEEEVQTKLASMISEWEAQEYARNRRLNYPDMGEQFNKIYDDGLTKWKSEMVDPVKTKWPKDNSGPV